MTRWAGGLIVFYGVAHTLGALTVEGAARHVGVWFSGQLRGDDLATMSPAMSAYWLSINSFGPPLILIGLVTLWMDKRRIIPPPFVPWTLIIWVLVGAAVIGVGVGQDLILLVASALLLAAPHHARRRPAKSQPQTP